MHMQSYPAEVDIKYVIFLQVVVQAYFVAVVVHFFIFCLIKPKIDNSLK